MSVGPGGGGGGSRATAGQGGGYGSGASGGATLAAARGGLVVLEYTADPLWTPADLATAPIDWFKADSGVTQASNNVTSWINNGSRGTALTNSSGANRPVYNAANSNFSGLPTIEATVAGQKLNMAGQTFPLEWTIDTEHFYDADNHTALLSVRHGALPTFPTNIMLGAVWPSTLVDTNSPKTGYYNAVLQTDVGSEGGATAGTAGWYMWIGRIKGAGLGATIYGRIVAPDGYMFNRSAGDRTGEIAVAEFLSGTGTLSSTDREKLEGYLAWKWGLQGSLPIGHPYKSAAPTPPSGSTYTLDAAGATLTLSSPAVSLKVSRVLPAAGRTLSLTAQAVTLRRQYTLTAQGQTLSLSGQPVGLVVSRKLVAAARTLAITAQPVGLRVGRVLPAAGATLALTGQAVTLQRGYAFIAQGRSLSLSAGAVGLVVGRKLAAQGRVVSVTGQPVGFLLTRKIQAQGAVLSLTGQDAGLIYAPLTAYTLEADGAVISLGAGTVGLNVGRRLDAAARAMTLAAGDVGLKVSRTLVAAGATFALTSPDVTIRRAKTLFAGGLTLTLDAGAASLTVSRSLAADGALIAVQPGDVEFVWSGAPLWYPVAPTPETWAAQSNVPETWSPAPTTPEAWSGEAETPEDWTTRPTNPEAWH